MMKRLFCVMLCAVVIVVVGGSKERIWLDGVYT